MKTLECIQIVFGLLAIGSGAFVLLGVFRKAHRCKWTVRFLEFSLFASIAGLLPLTHRLTLLQATCMLSVYCSGVVVLACHKFRLVGFWRPFFALFITVILYLNVVSVSIQLFNHALSFVTATTKSHMYFEITQLLLAAFFAVMGVMAVRKCPPEPAHQPERFTFRARIVN
jgi:hypothetical protein